MKRIPLCLIPPLAIAALWIQSANHKALHDLLTPLLAAIDSLQIEKFALKQDLLARQQEIAALNGQIATLTAQLQTPPAATAARRNSFGDGTDGARAQFASHTQFATMAVSEEQPAHAQTTAYAQTIQFAASTTATTADEYWRQIQEIADQNLLSRAEKTKLLKEGSALIQKLQEAQQNLQIDLESVQFLEVKAQDDGLDGLIALNNAKKKMAEQMTLIAQYQRDIETLINPHTSVSNTPKMPGTLTPGTLTPDALTPGIGQPVMRFSHLSMDSEVAITQNRTFLVTLHFFVTDHHSDPPQLVSVTDIFNLNTMQSASKQFFYPDYFLKDIYELVRKTWRGQGVKWNRKPTTEDLQVFLTIINPENAHE